MGTTEYVLYLIAAVVLTVAVGQVLLRRGEPFLEEVFRSNETAHSLNILLSVLFHLLTLGVLALLAPLDIPIITKFGVALVVVGIAYGISMLVLLRIRERRRQEQSDEERARRYQQSPTPPADPTRSRPPTA